MNKTLKSAIGVACIAASAHAAAQVTLYDSDHQRGRSLTIDRPMENLKRSGFNDRAASAVVEAGTWELCAGLRFSGRCVTLRPGTYDSLAGMNLNYQISSVRPVTSEANDSRHGYRAARDRDYRSRAGETLYAADIVAVRAVMGTPEQRCWVEREQVTSERSGGPNVGGAIAGAVIGGILGHQIGSGRGNDIATAGGAVGGAALGANLGRDRDGGSETYSQDVQRCANVDKQHPQYWDVTYRFRGQEHHVQMTEAPVGQTLAVTAKGEPRL